MDVLNKLKKLRVGKVLYEVNLENYTSYRLKGKIKYVVIPNGVEELITLLKYLNKNNIKYKVIGGGSNLIFEDSMYDGVIIKLDKFCDIKISDTKIQVGCGYSLMKLALKASRLGLTGLEFAAGIPGTVGGAVVNNSGAYKSDMGYIVESVRVLTSDYQIKTLFNRDLDYHYRTSVFKTQPGDICLDATIILSRGDALALMSVIEDRKQRRLVSQPLEFPSAGSVFRNPPGSFAGKLIEDINYKGKINGGAKVSEKHANFIINIGRATGKDVIDLINDIKKNVNEKYGIDLVLEQEIVK